MYFVRLRKTVMLQCSRSLLRTLVRHVGLLLGLVILICGELIGQGPVWVAQGPGPNTLGQVEHIDGQEVTGAIKVVAPHPTDPNVVFVGTVNGGIWKTTNGIAPHPNWESETDDKGSLSIGALAFDPTDSNHLTLVAGTGRFSSFGDGGARTGILRTTDGGSTWNLLDGGGGLKGLNISGVAPRGQTIVISANSADAGANVGVWRSTTGGSRWSNISGDAASNLPIGQAAFLASDPSNPMRLFTGILAAGIFMSIDTGATWNKVSSSDMDDLISQADNLKLSVGPNDCIYVAIDVGGRLAGIFRSGGSAINWSLMDIPTDADGDIHPGRQGGTHLSIVADREKDHLVYVAGDRQPARFVNGRESDPPIFPNAIGARDYTGRLFRGDASRPLGSQWVHLTHSNKLGASGGGTMNSSAPHADSRDMAFAANGDLIEVDDGGIYRRTNPRTNAGDWFSMNGNIQATEFHSVAWDANCHSVIGGAQDTGSPEQQVHSDAKWQSVSTGDGGVVAVDVVSTMGLSIRYTSFYNLGGFRRQLYSSNNVLQRQFYPSLTVLDSGRPIEPQFYTPLKLNAVVPSRLILGGANSVYESLDQGDTIREIGPGIVANSTGPIAYGAGDNPDIVYVGAGTQVYVRRTTNDALSSSNYRGTAPFGIAIDPKNANTAYVVNSDRVYRTTDAGAMWLDITGNLATLAPGILRSIAYTPDSPGGEVLVGSDMGVFAAAGPDYSSWSPLGTGLPRAPVYHIEYNALDHLILVGTLGRGAWTLNMPSKPAEPIHSAQARPTKRIEEKSTQPEKRAERSANQEAPQTFSEVGLPPENPSNSQPFELSPGIIVDPNQRLVFAMTPKGIAAVDISNGERIWVSNEAAKPIGFVNGRVIGQADSSVEAHSLTIVALDSKSGKKVVAGNMVLPANVKPSVTRTLQGDFVASAAPSDGNTIVGWKFTRHAPQRGIRPGTESTLSAPGGPALPAAPNGSESGAFRLNLSTGAVSQVSVVEAGQLQPTLQKALQATESRIDDRGKELVSSDGHYVLVSKLTGDDTQAEKYTLMVYDRKTRNRLGEFRSYLSVVPFFVNDSEVIFDSSAYVQRIDRDLVEQPRKIRAVNLQTGREVWSQEVRDTGYRGPFPP
jgi:hypothetical protein